MTMQNEPAATEHDPYVEALQGDGYKAWKGETEETPAPAAEPAAAPADNAAPAAQESAGQPRNPDGTFAPRADGQGQNAQQAPSAPLPFEGFDKLDPAVQNYFRRLQGERDDFKERYIRSNGRFIRENRTSDTRGNGNLPARSTAGNGQPAHAANLADARRETVALNPTQREAAQRQLDKWEAHAKAYPDDAAAIDQRIQSFRDDLAQGLDPLQRELHELRNTVQELRGGLTAIEAERAERRMHEAFDTIGQIAGDNWRQIAGIEDEHGNQIPENQRQWHPEFAAWINGHDPDIAAHYWETLKHPSPRVVGKIMAEFNREVFELDNPQGSETTPRDPVAQRRNEALRDTQPRSGAARTAGAPTWQPTGDPYVDAIRGGGYEEWKKA